MKTMNSLLPSKRGSREEATPPQLPFTPNMGIIAQSKFYSKYDKSDD